MPRSSIVAALADLRPDELWPVWRMVDLHEQKGLISETEACRWKQGVYLRMIELGVVPDDLVSPIAEPGQVQ